MHARHVLNHTRFIINLHVSEECFLTYMLTNLKIRTNDFLGHREYFKQKALKRQWNSLAMIGEDGDVIETANRCPTWYGSIISNAKSFFGQGGVGGVKDLVVPMPNPMFGDLYVSRYKVGKAESNLIPSYVPLAITEVKRLPRSVVVSYKGIGGAPDLIRLFSSGALRCTEKPANPHGRAFDTEYPLFSKVVIGVDDTDSSVKGATFNTALQLAAILNRSSKDYRFLRLTLSLNWPKNPAKTTNNASSGLVFAVTQGKEDAFVRDFERLIRKYTISKETGMVVSKKVIAPDVLKAYSRKVKRQQVTVDEAYKAAEAAGVKLMPITGERGLIGALSVVGLVDDTEEALTPVKLDDETAG
jgi:methanogenesis imperfect marker protein 11